VQRRDPVALRRVDVDALFDHRQDFRAVATHGGVGDRCRSGGARPGCREDDR